MRSQGTEPGDGAENVSAPRSTGQVHSIPLVSSPYVILVANAKGGCGKTTLASNLASYYAAAGQPVTLLDMDPQQSSLTWLKQRGRKDWPAIHGLSLPIRDTVSLVQLQQSVQQSRSYLVIDSPGGLHGQSLDHLLRVAQVVLVPVLPSPIDIRAATRFLQTIMLSASYRRRPRRLAVIANRARERTRAYTQLQQFLNSLKIPYLATLRDTQLYVQASGHGMGIFDVDSPRAEADRRQWRIITEWLEVQRHLIRTLPGFRQDGHR